MKRLFLIGGTMGVGKTAVAQCLKKLLPDSVFLDGDWCWDSNPFQVTDETKEMVMDNICCVLNNFIGCSAYENIIFCWVMHEQSIIDTILARTDSAKCEAKIISPVAAEETLRERIRADIRAGIREEDVLERSLARRLLYDGLNTVKIETDGKSAEEVAGEIAGLEG